jgi:predicted transcriptional regulator
VVSVWYHRWMALTYRPTDELLNRLREQADNEHLSVQALLDRAVEDYLERNAKKALITRSVAATKIEFADALRRLGEGA